MPEIEWTSDFEIGIFEIDLQHRSLVSIANQLIDAVEAGKPKSTIEWILDELLVYARMHFVTEEQYLKRYMDKGLSQHKGEHHHLLKAMRRFRKKVHDGDEDVGEKVLEFFSAWLPDHLAGSDQSLGEAYRTFKKGPK